MTANEAFDKVIWINCRQRPQRYKNMKRRLAEEGIDAEHMRCIEGCSPKALDLPYTSPRRLNCGELGCFYSHRTIYERMQREGWSSVLILEDDAEFCEGFAEKFAAIDFPDDWDLFYLGRSNFSYTGKHHNHLHGLVDIGKAPMYAAFDCWLTHAYAIHQRGIDKVLAATSEVSEGLDCVLARAMTAEKWKVYAMHPDLVVQDGSQSMLRANKV